MTRGTRLWIEGLMRAFFSGLSGTLGVAAVEPHLFDTGNAQKLALIGLIIGGIQVLQFLSQKPLPPTNGDDGGDGGGGGSHVSPLTGAFRSLFNTGDGMKKAASLALFSAIALVGFSACASNPKAQVLRAQQALQFGLELADDAERVAYVSGRFPGLTKEKHAEISDVFVRAYTEQAKLARAMRTWQPGDAIPASLDAFAREATALDGLIRAYAPGSADLAQKIVALIEQIAAFTAQLAEAKES